MIMLAQLFEEDSDRQNSKQAKSSSEWVMPRPSAPRSGTRLCGLSNLGATCYMNALLQTLHFTPEFREAIFSLSEDELGLRTSMVRAIPVELQELFARMLLQDQDTVGVDGLIGSFGWTNNEEMQQHDVQELNRILFDALESSLIDTSGHQLIRQLFHGTSVQKIVCQKCGRISEREEDFLDIAVALTERVGLEHALNQMYCDSELLEGANQYHCESCQQLVDAKRGCRLRQLPPILTFALLRFLYDFSKLERYKDITKFQFPMELDMMPFMETIEEEHCYIYELFSVIIHSGSTHSGHYTAFIKDIDNIGDWTHPDEDTISMSSIPPSSSATSGLFAADVLNLSSPLELLQAVLQQLGGSASLQQICKRLQDQTGVSWSKGFKQQHGTISKFIKAHGNVFSVSESGQIGLLPPTSDAHCNSEASTQSPVSDVTMATMDPEGQSPMPMLVGKGETQTVPACLGEGKVQTTPMEVGGEHNIEKTPSGGSAVMSSTGRKKQGKKKDKNVPPGERWFEFNDSHVRPCLAKTLDKMFQGKKSAYMLFYRLQSLSRPPPAMGNPAYAVPGRLQEQVGATNVALEADRKHYEKVVNTVTLTIHPSIHYVVSGGALKSIMEGVTYEVKMDRRCTVAELKAAIAEAVPDLYGHGQIMVIHTAKELPAGLHLYDCISDDNLSVLQDKGVAQDSDLFVWDGHQVDGEPVFPGIAHEPILLHINYPKYGQSLEEGDSEQDCDDGSVEMMELHCGFPKDSVLLHLRGVLASFLNCVPSCVTISHVQKLTRSEKAVINTLSPSKDNYTLEQLQLGNGDCLTAERDVKRGYKSFAHSIADRHNRTVNFIIENRCQLSAEDDYSVYPIESSKDKQLVQVKLHIKSQLDLTDIEEGGRLRIDDETDGLGPPLCENQSLTDAGITQGCRVVLEPGHAPLASEVVLTFSVVNTSAPQDFEIILDTSTDIKSCISRLISQAGVDGEAWHLRRSVWPKDIGDPFDDETQTIEQAKLKSGDHLFLVAGRLPPKGFIQMAVYHYKRNLEVGIADRNPASFLQWVSAGLKIPTSETTEDSMCYDTPASSATMAKEDMSSTQSQLPLHEQDPSRYYLPVPGEMTGPVAEIEISVDSTVDELKELIKTLPAFADLCIPTVRFLRVREMVHGWYPGRIFKQSSQTLRKLRLSTGTRICCSLLPHEEELSPSSVVFNLCLRKPSTRLYGEPLEVVYDMGNAKAATPTALCNHVAEMVGMAPDKLSLAKHRVEQFEWVRIQDSRKGERGRRGRGRGRGRGGGATVSSIKNAPVSLRDGDTVGAKDLRYDPSDVDDFSTIEDDKGRAILLAVQAEKRRRRKVKQEDTISDSSVQSKRQRKPETSIKIFVPDFSQPHPEMAKAAT